jgi:hypothetical protein
MVHLRFDEFQELSLLRTLFLTFLETAQCMSKFQLSREVNRAVSKTIHGEFCPGYGCEELFSSTNLDRLDLSQQVTYIPLYTSVLSTFMSVFWVMLNHFFSRQSCSTIHRPLLLQYPWHRVSHGPVAKSPADGKKLQIF